MVNTICTGFTVLDVDLGLHISTLRAAHGWPVLGIYIFAYHEEICSLTASTSERVTSQLELVCTLMNLFWKFYGNSGKRGYCSFRSGQAREESL